MYDNKWRVSGNAGQFMHGFRDRHLPREEERTQPVCVVLRGLSQLERNKTYLRQLPLILLHQLWVNLNLGGLEGGRSNELKARVAEKAPHGQFTALIYRCSDM